MAKHGLVQDVEQMDVAKARATQFVRAILSATCTVSLLDHHIVWSRSKTEEIPPMMLT